MAAGFLFCFTSAIKQMISSLNGTFHLTLTDLSCCMCAVQRLPPIFSTLPLLNKKSICVKDIGLDALKVQFM